MMEGQVHFLPIMALDAFSAWTVLISVVMDIADGQWLSLVPIFNGQSCYIVVRTLGWTRSFCMRICNKLVCNQSASRLAGSPPEPSAPADPNKVSRVSEQYCTLWTCTGNLQVVISLRTTHVFSGKRIVHYERHNVDSGDGQVARWPSATINALSHSDLYSQPPPPIIHPDVHNHLYRQSSGMSRNWTSTLPCFRLEGISVGPWREA